jgi:hypothetical protein
VGIVEEFALAMMDICWSTIVAMEVGSFGFKYRGDDEFVSYVGTREIIAFIVCKINL